MRHPLARVYALVVPAMAALVAWKATPLIPADAREVVRALPLFGLAAYTHLVFQIFWVNGLGFERGGARLLFLAPLDPARVLAAKNGALYLHSLLVFSLSAGAMLAVGGAPPGWAIAGALALHAGLAPALYGLGNVVTALNPRAAPLGVQRGGALPAVSALAGMAIVSVATSLFSVPVLLALRLDSPWALVAGWVALGGGTLAAYLRTLPAAGRLLSSRREAVVAAVSGDE
jgi:ABC-2 type transport system permease protein